MAYLAGKGDATDLGSSVPLYQIITKIFPPPKRIIERRESWTEKRFLAVRCKMLELINKCPLREWKVMKLSPAISCEWSTLISTRMDEPEVPKDLSCPWSQIFRGSVVPVQLMASSFWGVPSQATDYTVDHVHPPSSAAPLRAFVCTPSRTSQKQTKHASPLQVSLSSA